jgi:Fe-S-cluster-containing dehydrogenase component
VNSCPNGGFRVVNGKAKVVKKDFCDGLGYCIQRCPMGAIHYNGQCLDDVDHFCKDEPYIKNWPIKLMLVKSTHSQFKNADLAIVADCAAPVFSEFNKVLKGKTVLIFCPKLGNPVEQRKKLIEIIEKNSIKSITSYSVDYICCSSLDNIVKDAIRFSKKKDELMPTYKHSLICLFGVAK